MKTTLVFVAALVLGALLVYFLMPGLMPPAPTPTPPPPSPSPPPLTCEQLGPPPRPAVVLVMWNPHVNGCKLMTIPGRLDTCVGDDLVWQAKPIGRCAGYAGTLEIQLKPGEDPDDLETTPGQGEAHGRVPQRPEKCAPGARCSLEYAVTLYPTEDGDPPLVEDPHIDIW